VKRALIFRILMLCAVACAPSTPPAEPVITGEWTIERRTPDRESSQTCTFTQNGSVLGGTCSSRSGPVPLTGRIEGKNVNWTVKAESEGGPVTIVYKGAIDSETSMSGSVSALEFGVSGEFKATRSK
jgi:hypothetical protein